MGSGYGQLPITTLKTRLAHRWAYEFFIGPIPKGLVVMHQCDNRRCCNPLHLKLGTQQENLKDMRDKKRQGKHPKRYTQEKLMTVKAMRKQNKTAQQIADAIGVTKWTVFRYYHLLPKEGDKAASDACYQGHL
jgi:hypothetical protein